MILTCPQCATRYQTDTALFGAEGRRVRCAKCGNIWHQMPPDALVEPELVSFEEIEPAAAPPPPPPQRTAYAPAAYAPSASSLPVTAPVVSVGPELRRVRIDWVRGMGVAAGWVGLAALILAIGWSAMRFRQEIATLWPQTASLYAVLGKTVNTTGLAISNVHYRNETEDGQSVLAIAGQLTNITTHELSVPQILVTLTDDNRRVLYKWRFSAGAASLKPGRSLSFLTRLAGPPGGSRHLQVRLAENGK